MTWQRGDGKSNHVKGDSTCQGPVVAGVWQVSGTRHSVWLEHKEQEEHGMRQGHLTP